MVYIKEITLDFDGKTDFECISAVQGDNGTRFVKITFTQNNQKYTIPDNVTAALRAVKPNGHLVLNPCGIEDNKVIIELTEQLLALPGICKCEITLYGENGKSLTSAKFLIQIREASTGIEEVHSSNEFMLLQSLIEESYEMEARITANTYSLTYYADAPTDEQKAAEISTIKNIIADSANFIVYVNFGGGKHLATVYQYGGNIYFYFTAANEAKWYEISYFPSDDFLQYGYLGWGISGDAVTYTAQALTDEQKAQARANIGALSQEDASQVVQSLSPYLLPAVSADDNGKLLQVVDGVWAKVSLGTAEEASF